MSFTANRLNVSIVPHSLRWPEPGSGPAWEALHAAISTIRDTVAGVDSQITAVEQNGDLSDQGRLRQIGKIAMTGLRDLRGDPQIERARKVAGAIVDEVRTRVKEAVKAPTSAHEIALHAEIRAAARQAGGRAFVDKHIGDERVLAAVLTAPAFLSGLSDLEFNHLKSREESRLDPEAAATIGAVGKALEQLEAGLVNAENMVAQRGQLIKGKEGWEPRALASNQTTSRAAAVGARASG